MSSHIRIVGAPGALQFGPGRRDFAGEPPAQTMLDVLNRASQILIGVGKVGDLFGGRGLTRSALALPLDGRRWMKSAACSIKFREDLSSPAWM